VNIEIADSNACRNAGIFINDSFAKVVGESDGLKGKNSG